MVSSLALKRDMENIPQIDFVDMPEDDLRWSSISLKEVLERKLRLEASVFDIEGRHAREVIKNCKWPLMNITGENGFSNAYHRLRFKRIFLDKSDYPIYQPSQINEIYPKPYLYISGQTNTDIDKLRVHKNQLLLTCSGTIGNVTLVSKTLDNKIFSHDLIRITSKNKNEAGYLYAFLKSNIGRILINTNNYGAVIQHIEPEHLANIPIPNANASIKANIHEKIISSFELRDQSNELIDKAEKLLIDELNLPPIEEFKPIYFNRSCGIRNYQVKLSELNKRFDGSYHLPIVRTIIQHLKKYSEEVTTIGDNRISKHIILAGIFKRIYVKKSHGVPFLGGREIMELSPNVDKYLSIIHHHKRIEKELAVKENTVLVTDRGTIGNVALVPKHFEGWAISQNVIKIVPSNDDIAGYLYAFLNSVYGNILIKRETYGSVIDMIDHKNISNVRIPLLYDFNKQKQINTLVLEANNKRYEAYLLEQKAIQLINDRVIFNSK